MERASFPGLLHINWLRSPDSWNHGDVRCIWLLWLFAAVLEVMVLTGRYVCGATVVSWPVVKTVFRIKVIGGINSMQQYQTYFGMTGVGSQTRSVHPHLLPGKFYANHITRISIVFGIFTVCVKHVLLR